MANFTLWNVMDYLFEVIWDLENIQFKIPLPCSSSESNTNMGVDVNIHAGKGVRLYDRTLYNMFIGGDVHFGGTLQKSYC